MKLLHWLNKTKKSNKGFSLVELVVAIAILGVISGSVVGFMSTGTTSYKAVSNEADMQSEAQLASNQIADLIIDAKLGVSYSYTYTNIADGDGAAENVNDAIVNDTTIDTSVVNVRNKALWIYDNESTVYEIYWSAADKTLQLVKFVVSKDPTTNKMVLGTGSSALLAEYVSGFSADISKVGDNNTVSFEIDFDKNGKTYSVSKSVTLRNTIQVSTDLDDLYDNNTSVSSTVSSVTISKDGAVAEASYKSYFTSGTSLAFTATVNGNYFPSQNVAWVITGVDEGAVPDISTSTNTTGLSLASNVCTVDLGAHTTSGSFRLWAVSKQDSGKGAYVDILAKAITGVELAQSNASTHTDGKFLKGEKVSFTASLEGSNLDDSEYNGLTFAATYVDGSETKTISAITKSYVEASKSYNVEVTIPQIENKTVTVTATSSVDNSKAKSVSFEVGKQSHILTISVDKPNATRNSEVIFTPTITPNDLTGNDVITWTIESVTKNGNALSTSDADYSKIKNGGPVSGNAKAFKIKLGEPGPGKELDANSVYVVTVKATLKTGETATATTTIDKKAGVKYFTTGDSTVSGNKDVKLSMALTDRNNGYTWHGYSYVGFVVDGVTLTSSSKVVLNIESGTDKVEANYVGTYGTRDGKSVGVICIHGKQNQKGAAKISIVSVDGKTVDGNKIDVDVKDYTIYVSNPNWLNWRVGDVVNKCKTAFTDGPISGWLDYETGYKCEKVNGKVDGKNNVVKWTITVGQNNYYTYYYKNGNNWDRLK